MNTYNILWLDDEPISDLSLIEEENPNLKIQQVKFWDVCERLLTEHSTDYHAVILDANGLKSNEVDKGPNKNGVITLVKLAKEKGLPVYIYSGQIKRGVEESDITLEFLEAEEFHENINIFYKSGGSDPLIERIKKDLEQKYHIFYKYPVILDSILHYQVNDNAIKELLIWMNDKENHEFPVMSELRCIIYDNDIYRQVKKLLGIDQDGTIDFTKSNKHQICIEDWEIPIVNYLLKKLLNANTHNIQSDNRYLQEIVANSVIVTLGWFNRFMHKFGDIKNTILEERDVTIVQPDIPQLEDKTPVGIVEEDERTGLFTVNNSYIIPPKWARKYKGKRVRITKSSGNKYRFIAKKVDEV